MPIPEMEQENEDLHFLLAGETGAERFWDEEHEAWIRWNKTKVDLEGTEGLHITWSLSPDREI
ncbi:MAG: hypothetical protein ACLUOI_01550 [Eisenbergiella sp.]